ncbi:MAG: YqeG family HAD IIIA-type phosphatase [Clostridiales bacterium]|nr:YqeG family HAD IIIA-type phosphatase [Clostridiales bacterium]
MFLDKFYPKKYVRSIYSINLKKFYKQGYRGILFDIDNTLVPHGAAANDKAVNFFKKLRKIGFKVCLISNNKEERVRPFADAVEAPYICDARKPSTKNYIEAMNIIGTDIEETIFVGDQVFTDVFGANRANMYTILVKQINPKEEIQIVLKRYLERIVLYFYVRRDRKELRKANKKYNKKRMLSLGIKKKLHIGKDASKKNIQDKGAESVECMEGVENINSVENKEIQNENNV